MTKTKSRPKIKAKKASASITGKYVYDAKTDRIVKVSDRIPSVSSRRSSSRAPQAAPCGRMGGCGSGPCPR